jgi:acetyl esterase
VLHKRFIGQMHGFFALVNVLPASAAGLDFVVEAIKGRTA